MKYKGTQFGTLLSGDFSEKTLTFEMDSDFFIQAGEYALLKKDDYDEMVHELSELKVRNDNK